MWLNKKDIIRFSRSQKDKDGITFEEVKNERMRIRRWRKMEKTRRKKKRSKRKKEGKRGKYSRRREVITLATLTRRRPDSRVRSYSGSLESRNLSTKRGLANAVAHPHTPVGSLQRGPLQQPREPS